MGPLFTRMAMVWLEQQTANRDGRLKPTSNKRKRTDYDDIPNKRKIVINKRTKNDHDERLILSPRISPIISKTEKYSNSINRSLTIFQCQLCRRCLKNKDIYMDHMMICAVQRQASIKIVRAVKNKDEIALR